MSDPLSKYDIEDVLSSIRRLVSEELHPLDAAKAAPKAAAEAAMRDSAPAPEDMVPLALQPAAAEDLGTAQAQPTDAPQDEAAGEAAEVGKLILTPSLRVVADLAPEVEAVLPSEDLPQAAVDHAAEGAAEGQIGDAAFWQVSPRDAAPDHYDDVALDMGDNGLRAVLTVIGPNDSSSAVTPDDLIWAAAGVEEAPEGDPMPATEDHAAPGWLQDEAGWADDEPVAFVAHPRPHRPADPAAAPAPLLLAPDVVRPETLRIAADPALQTPPSSETGEILLDEDGLRALVRDIIREELAGDLGMRMTRNIRKLVRAELNRAESLRDFE